MKSEEKNSEGKSRSEEKISNEDLVVVLTVRCIDTSSPIHEVDRVPCSICGEMTWISRSFRGKKIDKIICTQCFPKNNRNGDYRACATQECIDEAFNLLKSRGYDVTKEEIVEKIENNIGKKVDILDLEKEG